ncbi:MAG: T9SS type A sorting domain-containing protein [Ignavibacteriae bacterium]|nr:T9SS type A sorting domain-containing protein [Ignavibacteriota bacterium]
MKNKLLTIILTLLFVTTITAQHNISYGVWMPISCEEGSTSFSLAGGSGFEGDEFVIPSYNIPPEYLALGEYFQKLQLIADVFAGARIGLPLGTLNEDVALEIDLTSAECSTPFDNLKQALSFTIKVVGSETGSYDPFSYYHFNEGKEAYIILSLANLTALTEHLKMNVTEILGWFAKEDLTLDNTGIRFEATESEFIIYLSHFSKIILGTNAGTTDADVVGQLPNDYNLGQNYPNPFNPTTNISYSLPQSGFTKLIVYNSIGVEVKTLVSEVKSAGSYKISFDASKLTSGIYFYDLTSNNFRSTKKMILIK